MGHNLLCGSGDKLAPNHNVAASRILALSFISLLLLVSSARRTFGPRVKGALERVVSRTGDVWGKHGRGVLLFGLVLKK